jgi:hypothetical protein
MRWWCLSAGPIALACLLLTASRALAQDAQEPIAFTRLLLTPEQFAKEWADAKPGSLVRLKASEFDRLVRDASRLHARLKPRLLETRYRAELNGPALVGSAEWKTLNPNDQPSRLAIEPFTLAVRRVVWSDNQPALFAPAEGQGKQTLELLLSAAGERSLILEWSAAGTQEPDGLRFELGLPVCMLGSLELDTPADRVVTPAGRGTFITQPYLPQRKTWRIVPTPGSSALSFVVRNRNDAKGPPLVRTRTDSKLVIEPTQITGEFEFTSDVVRGTVNELAFRYDSSVYPIEVSAEGATVESWQAQPGKPGQAGTLRVYFREPVEKTKLTVRALCPVPALNQPWSVVALRPLDCLSLGESLRLRVHPQVRVEDFQPADFRLVSATPDPDRWVNYQLESDLPSEGGDRSGLPKRPSLRLRSQGLELRVNQTAEWRVWAERSLLKATLRCEVQSGEMRELTLGVPAEYKLLGIASDAGELVSRWNLLGKADAVRVELTRSIRAGQSVSLTVELAGPAPPSSNRPDGSVFLGLPIPDIPVPMAVSRVGTLTVFVAPNWEANVIANVPAEPSRDNGEQPTATLAYRSEGLRGRLYLSQRGTTYEVRSQTSVRLGLPGQISTRLHIEPQLGAVRQLMLRQSANTEWVAQANAWQVVEGKCQVQAVESIPHLDSTPHLLGLANTDPLAALATLALAQSPQHTRWQRLTLDRPISGPVTLEHRASLSPLDWSPRYQALTATRPLAVCTQQPLGLLGSLGLIGSPASVCPIPLLLFPDARAQQGTVSVEGLPVYWSVEHNAGLSPLPQVPMSETQEFSWQRTDRQGRVPQLWLEPQPPSPRAEASRVESAELNAAYYPGQGILCRYTGQVQVTQAMTSFRLKLPVGAVPVRVSVDGRRVALAASTTTADNRSEVSLMLAAGRPKLEVAYLCPVPKWIGWTTLNAPAPELACPVPPLRRVWQLPAGIQPLDSQAWVQTDGPDAPAAVIDCRRADLVALRRLTGKFAAQAAEAEYPLVDTRSRRGDWANPAPSTGLSDTGPAQPWPVALFQHTAVGQLWTDPLRRSNWLMQTHGRGVPECVRQSLEQAARDGRDAQGRFVLSVGSTDAPPVGEAGEPEILPDATEWVVRSGTTNAQTLLVVDTAWVWVGGWSMGLGWLVLALVHLTRPLAQSWLGRVKQSLLAAGLVLGPLALVFLLILADAAVMGLFWPTVWLAGAVLGVLGLRWAWSNRRVGQVLVGCVALMLGSQSLAQPASPWIVYLLESNRADEQLALVPAGLLKKLESLVRQGERPSASAVLMHATYRGKVNGELASFEGRFGVYVNTDEDTAVQVPLTGVLLNEVRLDGAAAHPQVAAAGDRFFTIPVKGRGSHQLTFRFTVPLRSDPLGQELRFGVPDLPASKLILDLPAESSLPGLVPARGWYQLRQEAGATRLEMDLGRVPVVELRFRPSGSPPEPVVRVQEASLWRISPARASVTTALQYQLVRGSLKRMMVDMPAELEVVQLQVRGLDKAGAARLRNWTLGDSPLPNCRRLTVQLLEPTQSGAQLLIECMPRTPPTRTLTLRYPQSTERASIESRQAFWLSGLQASEMDLSKLALIPEEQFLKESWRPLAGEANAPVPTRAFVRDLKRPNPTSVRVVLKPAPLPVQATQDLLWQIGPDRVELQATARLTVAQPGLSLVEWDVPGPLRVSELAGPDVRTWSRSGNRVQVWLNRPATETLVTLTGSIPWPGVTSGQVAKLDLPGLQLANVTTTTKVVVQSPPSLAVRLGERRNLALLQDRVTPESIALQTRSGDFGLSVQVQPAEASVRYRLLSQVQLVDRALHWQTTIRVQPQADCVGKPHRFELVLRGWLGQPPRLSGPAGVQTQTITKVEAVADAESRWRVEVPSLPAEGLDLDLAGRLEPAGEWIIPTIDLLHSDGLSVAGVPRVAVVGAGLTVRQARRWQRLSQLPVEFNPQLNQVAGQSANRWLTHDPEALLHLQAVPAQPSPPQPATLELTDHTSTPSGDRWLHRSRWLVRLSTTARLELSVPAQVETLAVLVDGAPLKPGPTLTLQPGLHTLSCCWQSSEPYLGPLHLRPPQPTINGQALNAGQVTWTVLTPAEINVTSPAMPSVARSVVHAEAYLRTALAIEAEQAKQTSALLAQAAGLARLAELQAQASPNDSALAQRIARLRDQTNQVSKLANPLVIEREPYSELFTRGTPHVWVRENGQALPTVQFRLARVEREQGESVLVLLLAVSGLGVMVAISRRAGVSTVCLAMLMLLLLGDRLVQGLAVALALLVLLVALARQASATLLTKAS